MAAGLLPYIVRYHHTAQRDHFALLRKAERAADQLGGRRVFIVDLYSTRSIFQFGIGDNEQALRHSPTTLRAMVTTPF